MQDQPLKPGDLVITPHAFPLADYIVQASMESKQLYFYPYFVEQLLGFLETVVLYDRVVAATCQIESSFAEQLQNNDVFERHAAGKIISEHYPVADLSELILGQLRQAGVIADTLVTAPKVNARALFDAQLESSPLLQTRVQDVERQLLPEVPDPDLRREMARLITWTWAGRPLYIAESARVASVPHQLAGWEAEQVEPVERADRRTFSTLVRLLSDRVNEATRIELQRIQSLGGRTPFPATPIAWQILSSADKSTDLATVALQLRSEYAGFRAQVQSLEAELRSDDVTVKRKGKITDELDQLVQQLWPAERRGFRREIIDTVSLVAALPAHLPTDVPAAASTITSLLSLPFDALLRAFRYRRYRVLFRTRRNFLKARGTVTKLATVFDLPTDVIQEGFAKNSS